MIIPGRIENRERRKAPALFVFTLTAILVIGCTPSTSRADDGNGLFPVSVDGKYGYIDTAGKIAIATRFSHAWEFSDGLAAVEVGSRSRGYAQGFIDSTGQLVVAAKYADTGYFSDGLAPVGLKTGKSRRCFDCDPNLLWGFINRGGAYAIKPQFHRARSFSEGLAAVQDEKSRLWGYIRKDGALAITFQFTGVQAFSEGLACVLSGKRFGYVDAAEHMVIAPQFSHCGQFSEGLALVRLGGDALPLNPPPGRFGYIDKTGRVVFQFDAEAAGNFSGGLAHFGMVVNGVLRYGFHNKEGRVAIEPQFSMAEDFSEGHALVLLNGWGFIGNDGQIAFRLNAALVEGFRRGLARVTMGENYDTQQRGYIDRTGKFVWKPTR